MLKIAQYTVSPFAVGGLAAVAIVAALSFVVWLWAMRRPAAAQDEGPRLGERSPLTYVAIGAQTGLGLDNDDLGGRNWVSMLREKMPEGTRLVTLGRRGITVSELAQVEIPAAMQARPDIVTLWNVISDALKSIALVEYINNLHRSLTALARGTEATIILLNLPDISLLAREVPDEQRALIRGGVEQWNRAIADAAAKYGRRVRVVDLFPESEQLLVRQGSDDAGGALPDHERNALLAELVWKIVAGERLLEAR